MSLKIGIVGLPNAGKSTLFNALLKRQQAQAENRPFTTIEPNVGIVDVPDRRLNQIYDIVVGNLKSETLNSKQTQNSNIKLPKLIPATIEFVDIAGLVKGAAQGAGLGNKFLSHIREVDAIIILLRSFEDSSIIHTEGRVDPADDLKILETELGLADQEHPEAPRLLDKPRLIVYNVDENELRIKNDELRISAKIEAELAELTNDEQLDLLNELGVKEPPLNRVILEAYKLLGLQTFFTAGPQEVRAWTVKQGATAPQAAGVIHTDFQRGFIRAEIIAYNDYVALNGELGAKAARFADPWATARRAGKLRSEGKDYIMTDGDVCHFRFNV